MTLNLEEAMMWAADFAEQQKLFTVPVKTNGYPVDNYKVPSAMERVQILKELASTVVSNASTNLSFVNLGYLKAILHDLEAAYDNADWSIIVALKDDLGGRIRKTDGHN